MNGEKEEELIEDKGKRRKFNGAWDRYEPCEKRNNAWVVTGAHLVINGGGIH